VTAVLDHLRQLDLLGVAIAVVDVAIVAYFIYRVLLLIRGTRAAYMLTGLLLVAGIFFVANQLALTTLSWLLDHLINYVIIIVIIVFQADIRRGLSRMGRRMFSPSRASEDVAVIEEIVAACEAMAKSRTGALIVLERDADLSEDIDPGTAIDARVSRALLCSLFTADAENPLHDGAVLIKGQWVQQAGAILPLSRNPGLDKDLGTRHRAAVGVTEESDAVAVVVSEQRGSIGLASAGLLHMGMSAPTLRRELLALVATDERKRWRWLERLMRRWERAIGAASRDDAHDEHRPVRRRVTGVEATVAEAPPPPGEAGRPGEGDAGGAR
jgi:diadenylate cyclase